MKKSNTFKISTFNLKISELKRSFLVFNQILLGQYISRIFFLKIHKTSRIESPFKNEKWEFLSQMDNSGIISQVCPKLSLY